MKNLAKILLRILGVEIRRVPRSALFPKRIAKIEQSIINQTLRRFAKTRPSESPLSNFKTLRAYLSDSRIMFFHEVLAVARNLNVELTSRRIADVGSGTGYLLHLIANTSKPAELVGFDTFVEMNELARMFCPGGTIHDSPLQAANDKFDIIFCTEVLEHMTDPTGALTTLFDNLSDNGVLILTVPNGRKDQHKALEMREDGSAYWGHINFWSPENWPIFLKQSIKGAKQIHTCTLKSGENFAAVWRSRDGCNVQFN